MLCNNCSNRTICKYYAFFADAPMVIDIESCEKYSSKAQKNVPTHSYPDNTLQFKEPIDYSKFNIPDKVTTIDEKEERITVDLSEDHSSKVVSITDILLGEEGEDE